MQSKSLEKLQNIKAHRSHILSGVFLKRDNFSSGAFRDVVECAHVIAMDAISRSTPSFLTIAEIPSGKDATEEFGRMDQC